MPQGLGGFDFIATSNVDNIRIANQTPWLTKITDSNRKLNERINVIIFSMAAITSFVLETIWIVASIDAE